KEGGVGHKQRGTHTRMLRPPQPQRPAHHQKRARASSSRSILAQFFGSPALLVKGGRPLSRRRQACSTAGGACTVVAALVNRATAPAPGGAPTPRVRTSGA